MSTFNGQVIEGGLNLRTSTSTSASSPIQIPNGTNLTVSTVAGKNDWFATSYGGYSGYVVARYIAITNDGGTCTVTTASGSLNIRKTPSSSASIIYTAAQYSTLRLLDYTSVSSWYRVSSAKGTGWAQSKFLTINTYPGTGGGDVGGDSDTIPAPAVQITATLQLNGSNNTTAQVTALQNRLNQLCYYCGVSDGDFDTDTDWAVRYFQEHNGLSVDGIVGTNTRAKLNASGANCGTLFGVDGGIRGWEIGTKPQQWYMNGGQIWSNTAFDAANTSTVETIGDSGNAPTSFAMIASTFRGTAITPPIVCNYVITAGLRDNSGNTGVKDGFFTQAATKYSLSYYGTVNSISAIQTQLNNGRLVLVRVVGSDAHNYCSKNGATYLVIWKIENGLVYVMNPNYITREQPALTTTAWSNGGWMREGHVYGY